MKPRIPDKTLVIIILTVLTILLILIPFERLAGRPSILGAVISKVFVKPLEANYTCSINLTEGWNLMGIACSPQNTSVDSMLNPLIGNYTSIHAFDASAALDNWKSYNPNLPSWVILDLDEISNKKGYWIRINSNSSLSILGIIPLPDQISLLQGWNLIGYPSASSKVPPTAFSTISGSYSIVWTYNTSQDVYLYYDPNLGSGTIAEIRPDKGYWINMTTGDTLWIT